MARQAAAFALLVAVACLLTAAPTIVSAQINCLRVVLRIVPCLRYTAAGGQGPVPFRCCSGLVGVAIRSGTTEARRATCNCLTTAFRALPDLNATTLSGLPPRCGVSIPFLLSPTTNCTAIP